MQREGAWKKDAWVLLVLFAIPTVLTADVLFFANTFYYRDLTGFFFPALRVYRDIVLGGDLPLWNWYFSGGQPLAANPEFAVFYPLRWIVLLSGFIRAFNFHLIVHLYVALAGMYLFLRSMALQRPAAAFGAFSFGASGFIASYFNLPAQLITLVWIPLILLFARQLLLRPSRGNFAAAAILIGMQHLAGEPTTILQTALLMIALGAQEVWAVPAGSRKLFALRSSALLIAVSVCGALVGAAQLFATIDLARDTVRAQGLPFQTVSRWSMPFVRPLEFFYPAIMGHKSDAGFLYWGVTFYRQHEGPFVLDLYLGLATAVLAVAALVTRQKGWGVALLTILSGIALASGARTPVLRLLYDWGMFTSFRYPEKFILLAVVPLVVQASIGCDRLLEGHRRMWRASVVVGAILLTASVLLLGCTWLAAYESWVGRLLAPPDARTGELIVHATRTDWFVAAVRCGVLIAMLVAFRASGLTRAWLGLATLFLVYDVGTTFNRDLPRLPSRFLEAPPIAASVRSATKGSRLFHEADTRETDMNQRRRDRGEAAYWNSREGLYPKLPALWGIETVLEPDYDLTHVSATRELYLAMLLSATLRAGAIDPFFTAVSNAGVVARTGVNPGSPLQFERTGPDPRYQFATELVEARGPQEVVRLLAESKWRRGVAFVRGPAFKPAPGGIRAVRERANLIDLEVLTRGTSFLVLSVTRHRYWQATVDGRPATIQQANLGYMGIVVPAGARTVSLRYSNPVIFAGAAVSAVTLFFLILSAMIGRTARALDDKQLPAR